jgi:hypothetical protein
MKSVSLIDGIEGNMDRETKQAYEKLWDIRFLVDVEWIRAVSWGKCEVSSV